MATFQHLEIGGLTPEEVFIEATKRGVAESDAAVLVSSWIFEQFGRTRRTFNYSQAFATADPACVSDFDRAFQHEDWVDGESVVQAERTAGEDGFNLRFHRLETDLDDVGANLVKVFTCLAAMRSQLSGLLNEIRAELNRINSDVFECCGRRDGGFTLEQVPGFIELVENPKFLGTATFNEKVVNLWNTKGGVVALPHVLPIQQNIVADPRINNAGRLAEFLAKEPRVEEFFIDRTPTKEEFLEQFGDVVTDRGDRVSELVKILPESSTFGTPTEMVDAVAERQAAAIRTTIGAEAVISQALGIESGVEHVREASVDHFTAIPTRVRTALIENGIATIDALAGADLATVTDIAKNAGVSAEIGDAANWRGLAQTLKLTR